MWGDVGVSFVHHLRYLLLVAMFVSHLLSISGSKWSRLIRGSDSHWSFFLIPQMQAAAKEWPMEIKRRFHKPKHSYLTGPRSCPKSPTPLHTGLHENGFNCPVFYVLEHDPARIPSNIVHARCSCTHCRYVDDFLQSSARCEPVYTYTDVIRQVAGKQIATLERIPIACTCKLEAMQTKPAETTPHSLKLPK